MASSQSIRVWPTLLEYDNALKDANTTVHDPDIRDGKLVHDCRPLRLSDYGGKYVTVYKFSDWVVRCFFTNVITSGHTVRPPEDIHERYREINNYFRMHMPQLNFLVPQIWVENAISIDGQDWPFIKSAFVQHSTLGAFLMENREQIVIRALAKQWLAIINTLESLDIAHGDLDATNVLVCGTYPNVALRLVDFDSMYIPALEGRTLYEQGHMHFQPTQPGVRQFNRDMDRFSAVVIYLSLIALAEDPQLWEQCKANEDVKLLLSADDFRNLGNSSAYKTLRKKQNNQDLQKCLDELVRSIQEERMPRSLSDILKSTRDPEVTPPPVNSRQLSTSLYYEAPSIPIPLSFMTPSPSPQTPSSPEQIPQIMIPIPTSYLQSPPVSSQSSSSPSGMAPHGLPSKINPAVWWLLSLAGLIGVIALAAQVYWLLLITVLVLLIMFGVASNKN